MKQRKRSMATYYGVLATWAALYAVSGLLPATSIVGTGANFSLSSALVPLGGIFFGPLYGGISVAVGAVIGQMIAPNTAVFGPATFLCPTVGAVAAGFAMQKRWIWPLAATLILGLSWYASPLGRAAWFTPTIYLLGIPAIGVGWIWGGDWLRSKNSAKMFAGLLVVGMAGGIVGYELGNLLAIEHCSPL
ncbi:MAG: hypothetical protein NTU41_12630 [Chloroflexi bacterium]|nr:hypothetical protein [Chloroflexota bacterium]